MRQCIVKCMVATCQIKELADIRHFYNSATLTQDQIEHITVADDGQTVIVITDQRMATLSSICRERAAYHVSHRDRTFSCYHRQR